MSQDTAMATIEPGGEEELDAQMLARRVELALSITRYVAQFGAIMVFSLVILWLLLLQQYVQLPAFAVLVVPVVASAWAYPAFHRRGQATIGINLFLASLLFLFATGSIFVLPEMLLAAVPMYVFFIILSNLLLETKNGLWLTGACVFIFAVVVTVVKLWTPGWYLRLSKTIELVMNSSFSVFALLAVAVMVRRIIKGQDESIRQSQQANLEIERRAAGEQEQRECLQMAVRKYVDYMATVGQGNLAARLTLDGSKGASEDPLITLGRQLNETVGDLQDMILQIRDAANNLNSATAEILAAANQQVSGASQQSAAISQTTTTVDEVKTIAEQSVARAQEVAGAAQRTVEVSRAGQHAVGETIASMTQIKARVESIAENILALAGQTQQIGEIIATVNDIAAQSNLLALNASVEASRAGEYGRGFAVVAVEVRNLAEQSRQATAQVKTILSDIQKATNATVIATEEGTQRVDEGMHLAAQAGEAVEHLAVVIEESAQVAAQMVAGGRQQASGVEQIATAMQNIYQATVQSLSGTRQAEKAAQNLNNLARSLTEIVEQYQL
jgi:methyl-accepting chemotaxis protein